MYKIIALIGEAGSGKDRVMQEVLAAAPDRFNEIISCTTRPMREGEQEGVNYYYLTKDKFIENILANKMLEYTVFNGWNYGTSKDTLKKDKINIGVFNPEGIRNLLDNVDIDLTVFRVSCKDKTRLLRQLNRENDPNVQEIVRRFNTDFNDFAILHFGYKTLTNETPEDLEACVKEIMAEID